MENTNFLIYSNTKDLPKNWDDIACDNAFLQTPYLKVLEASAPINMQCFYIGIFENNKLTGVALAQYLNLSHLESFGERDKCLTKSIRNFAFRNLASHVLILGNNMITGQNGYIVTPDMKYKYISELLIDCAQELTKYFKKQKITIHIVTFKDFYTECAQELKKNAFSNFYEFNTQPNMIFDLSKEWKSYDTYINQFTKKYRDQYKRAIKKFDGIETRELSLSEIEFHEDKIYELYHHVAKNAPFNTFFLAKNHFSTFKKQCGGKFALFGYFLNDKLVGFHSLLLNQTNLETYFLGYDATIQKENMLYLNMLYNMTKYGIEHNFERIIFGRTALEIKSSIGAKPVEMSGFIYHNNPLVNKYLRFIFPKLEPKLIWQQRHPFKQT